MTVPESMIDIAELLGDTAELAEVQFRFAHELCGKCRDYHALWPYRRLAALAAGIETDADFLQPILRGATPQNGRILICGAADAGLLSLTGQATHGLSPAIDVADRCPTPLAVCRAYARPHGLPVRTFVLDLAEASPPNAYDVVLAHLFVQFVREPRRVEFFRRLGRGLTKDGRLVLVERVAPPAGEEPDYDAYSDQIVRVLAARGVTLPEEESAFRQRLRNFGKARAPRVGNRMTPQDLRSYLSDAGFRITEWHEHQRRRTVPSLEGVQSNFLTYIAVASPA